MSQDFSSQFSQEDFNRFFEAYQAGRDQAERDDRFDKLLASMTSSNVTQQLVDALERLATGARAGRALTPEEREADQVVREIARRMGVRLQAGPPSARTPGRLPGNTLTFDSVPDTAVTTRVFAPSGVYEVKSAANEIRVRSSERVARVEFLDGTGQVVGFTGPETA